MKKKIALLIGSAAYVLAFIWLFYKYVPQTKPIQILVIPLLLLVVIVTSLSLKIGTVVLVSLIPLTNSLPYFFGYSRFNPLLFLFYAYFLGFLIYKIRSSVSFRLTHPVLLPLLFATGVVLFSALVSLWRYTNFVPLFSTSVFELSVNVLNVSTGEAIRRVLFDSLNLLAGFLWFIIVVNVLKTKEIIRQSVFFLAISTILSFCVGFYQAYQNLEFGNIAFFVSLNRVNGLFTDPNALGVYMVLAIPLFAGALLTFKSIKKPVFLVAVLGGFLLVPSVGSRSGFLGLVAAFVFFFLFGVRSVMEKRNIRYVLVKKAIIYAVFLVVIVILVAFLFLLSKESSLPNRLTKNIEVLSRSDWKEEVLRGRQFLWSASKHMIKDYPLSGVGIGAYTCELPNFYKKYNIMRIAPVSFYQKASSHNVLVDSAGNYYLQIASELGIFGLILFLWIFYFIGRKIYFSNIDIENKLGDKTFIAGITSGILAMFLIFLFGVHTLSFEIQMTFWLSVGLLYGLSASEEKKTRLSKFGKISAGVLVLLFVFSFIWNSAHSLSLHKRTESFGLVQNFGLYAQEKADEREFQWTKKTAGLHTKVQMPFLVVPLIASHPDIRENPVRVRVSVTQQLFRDTLLLDEITIKENRWQNFTYDLSKYIGDDVILLFETNRTWSPGDLLGTSDTRDLGVGIGLLKFEGEKPSESIENIPQRLMLLRKFSESDWNGSQGGDLRRIGTSWLETTLPEGDFLFRIEARGQQARGEWPYMVVMLNDEMLGGEWVSSEEWTFFSYQKKLKSGRYRISVEFINDWFMESLGEDRNLFIWGLDIIQLK